MEIFWLNDPVARGRLGVCTRPRGGDWLNDDLAVLRDRGCDVLVSLLAPEEEAELELRAEGEVTERLGLTFVPTPVDDFGVPSESTFRGAVSAAARHLKERRNVLAHCREGIGRSPTFVASVLVLMGEDCDRAWARVEAARGRAVPDTPEQRAWLSRVVRWRV